METSKVDLRISWRTEVPQWLLLVAMFVAAAVVWPRAPERIPVHWGVSGAPDRFGGKAEGLLLLPLIALGVYVLMLVLPRLDPSRANYAAFAGAYAAIRICIPAMLAAVYAAVLLASRGQEVSVSHLVPAIVGLGLLGCGSVMGKVRPNWFVGIRTPWTLSSRLAWTRTHRLGGWVLMGIGALLALAGLSGIPALLVTAIAGASGGALWLFVYSYFVWRSDPDRVPPLGTAHGPL